MATTGTTGILTPDQEKQLAVWLDDLVKLKGLLELVDGYIFRILITLLDDKVLDKLKADLKAQLSKLVEAAMAGQVDEAEQLATDILVGLVQIPGIDSTVEGLIFSAAIQLAVAAVISKLAVTTGKPITLKVAEAKAKLAKPTKKTKRSWE
jgi:hypothetical protein